MKAVSSNDLFAIPVYAIILNQERSVVNVGPMRNMFFLNIFTLCVSCLYNRICLHKYMKSPWGSLGSKEELDSFHFLAYECSFNVYIVTIIIVYELNILIYVTAS